MKIFYLVSFLLVTCFLGSLTPLQSQDFWQSAALPNVSSTVPVFAIDAQGAIYAGTNGDGLFRSLDHGASWTKISTPTMNYFYGLTVLKNGDLLAGSFRGQIYHSTDKGSSWLGIDSIGAKSIVTSFATLPNGEVLAATGSDGFYVSKDNGMTWNHLTTSQPKALNIFPMATDAAGTIFVGTYGDGVYRVLQNGAALKLDGLSGKRVNALVRHPNGHMFAATDFGVFHDATRLDTNAETGVVDTLRVWVKGDTGLTRRTILALAVTPGGVLYAASAGDGIYTSTNDGVNWSQLNTGLGTLQVWSIALTSDGFLFCGGGNGRVYRSVSAVSMVPMENPPAVAGKISSHPILEQNYPNPFNPTTHIPFILPGEGFTSLKIYNALGQEIATLAEGTMGAGRHEVVWDASAYPSGIYFYRLQSASSIQSGKLMLTK